MNPQGRAPEPRTRAARDFLQVNQAALVRDRDRFERLWGWVYRFEAYTPAPKRKLGYYALPLLWRDRAIGWGNISLENGALRADVGYIAGRPPRERRFSRALDAELERLRIFLGPGSQSSGSQTEKHR